jgi:HEAT repeat protein
MRRGVWIAALGAVLAAAAAWKVALTPEYLCVTGNGRTKHEVIISLKSKARWRARVILRRLVRDPDPGVRMTSLACMRMLDLKKLAPAAARAARGDEDALVRAQAMEVLAELDAAAAAPLALKGLQDPDPDIRIGALLAAGRGAELPAPCLLATLRDEESRVREAALDTVTRLRIVEAVPTLANDLRKQELFELSQTHDALQKITGVNKGIEKKAWLDWYSRR